MLSERRSRWPRQVEVVVQTPPPLGDAAAVVTFIGHSTFLIQTPAGNLLTDPMFSDRAGPFGLLGPRRVRQPAVRFDELPPIGTVLLSHNHYDHCDLPTLRKLARRFDPVVVTPLGNARLVRSAGIRRIEELDWWEQATIGTLSTTLTPAQHFSARTPFDRNRALWAGFVVRFDDRRIYYRRRHGLRGLLSRRPAAARSDRSGAPANRRLRAALVHARRAHEPGRSRPGAHRSRRTRDDRHALRDVPAHGRRASTTRSGTCRRHFERTAFRHRAFARWTSGNRCASRCVDSPQYARRAGRPACEQYAAGHFRRERRLRTVHGALEPPAGAAAGEVCGGRRPGLGARYRAGNRRARRCARRGGAVRTRHRRRPVGRLRPLCAVARLPATACGSWSGTPRRSSFPMPRSTRRCRCW